MVVTREDIMAVIEKEGLRPDQLFSVSVLREWGELDTICRVENAKAKGEPEPDPEPEAADYTDPGKNEFIKLGND